MRCWCETCRPITLTDMRMVVCPNCGDKRCPHATDHRNDCATPRNVTEQEDAALRSAARRGAKIIRPAPVPMTDKQIIGMLLKLNEPGKNVETATEMFTIIVRAIEAHHGITSTPPNPKD